MSSTMTHPSPTPTPQKIGETAADLGITPRDLDQLCVDTIRMLAVDMTNEANSGHPGLPMGAADMAYVLWTKFLRFDPEAPDWRDRDRFVLSAGHGSCLIYALLHLSGYDLSLDELRNFRQANSKTPGHPEAGLTPGVEVTTGPLGQGIANAVGIAMAGRMLGGRFNRSNPRICTHRTFALISDGDVMEGISAEAASLAGHWRLGNLVALYDANDITIDGSTDLAFSTDVAARFASQGWHVTHCDGHDRAAVEACIAESLAETDRPSLVIARTVIGKGSPNRAGTEKAHGSALGAEETTLTKQAYGWPVEETFLVPSEVSYRFAELAEKGRQGRLDWEDAVEDWTREDATEAGEWDAYWGGCKFTPEELLAFATDGVEPKSAATRKHSGSVIQRMAERVPNLVGGSADLSGSNCTVIKQSGSVGVIQEGQAPNDHDYRGRNIHFGVREHAMGAILNGMCAHGSFVPYGATFLAFLDYMRAPVRLASLSGHGSIFVYTHDSIGLGEDGPTHQPIEHLWTARMIPGMTVHRPADYFETAAAWADAIARRDGPTILVLTRQSVPVLDRGEDFDDAALLKGGYVLRDAGSGEPQLVLIATGSEVGLALGVREQLEANGVATRVVSMPSLEVFDRQDEAWRHSVLPEGPKRVAIEAGRPDGWYRITGREGLVIGIETFGHSAPQKQLYADFGLTVESVVERISAWHARD